MPRPGGNFPRSRRPCYIGDMRRVHSRGRGAAAKSRSAPKSVDEYLARIPEPARSKPGELRALIRSAVPAEAREVISYQIPAFHYKGLLVWYAAFSDHCSLFPSAFVIQAFKKHLKAFTTSKGTVRFPLDRPLPAALVRQLVRARVAQAEKMHPKPPG
jgi:uncharacterized protein YdhG (YjbR/CyaY superfamily)